MRHGIRLGLDPGDARIGVARSDPSGLLATPVETVQRGRGDLARIAELLADEQDGDPERVLEERAVPGVTTPIGELLPQLRAEGVRGVSPTGVLGDPAGASAEEGAALLAGLVTRLVAAARAWDVDPSGRLC